MKELILATRNKGKIREFTNLIQGRPWKLFSLDDFPRLPVVEEKGTSFAENARLKALSAARETGIVALADDSGLEVDALGGLPGIYSARFAGEPGNDQKSNEKLLLMLKDVPADGRTARFRCTIAVAQPNGRVDFCEGVCEGMIGNEPVGTDGFGYDPLFILLQYGKTMAQLNMEEKNLISHRGKAFQAVLPLLDKILSNTV